MALEYISSRVFNVVRRTVGGKCHQPYVYSSMETHLNLTALNSQIHDEELTANTTAALNCCNGSYFDRMIDCLSQHPRADIESLYNPLSYIKQRRTGNWLLQLPEFNSWMQNDNSSIFWLSGSIGSGKSVLTSYVVEDLKQRLQNGSGCIIASYFFDARYKVSATTAMVLREMILEVLPRQNQSSIREKLQSILVSLDTRDTKISPSQLRAYFTAIRHTLAVGESMFLILDGLDEADESEINLIEELIYLARHQNGSHQIKCFISSRPHWSPNKTTDEGVRINIDHEARAREYLAYFIQSEAENLLEAKYYGDILYRKLSSNPEGAFSRAVLALRTLGQVDESNEGRIPSLIESLPSTLTGMYQLMLDHISEKDRINARKLLAFVTYTARPLRVSELLTLMNLNMRDVMPWGQKKSPHSSGELHYTEEDIPRLTGGLVTACDDNTVNFVHHSARDYVKSLNSSSLLGDLSMSEQLAHELLTRICFHYLHPNPLRQFLELSEKYQIPTGDQSFTGYAVQYWSFHYRIAEAQSDSLPGLLHHVIRENLNSTYCGSCGSKGISLGANTQDCTNAALGIGTQIGSEKLVRMLLEAGANPNIAVNSNGETVLHIAAKAGNLNMVELFLQRGAYINPTTTKAERTPLYYASAGGYPDVMRALLDAGKMFSCGLNAFNDPIKCVPLCTSWNVHALLDYNTDALPLNNLRVVSVRELCSQMLAYTDELSQRLWTARERLEMLFGDVTSKPRKYLASDTRRAYYQNEGNLALLQHAAREALIQKLLENSSDGVWQYNESWGVEDFSAIEVVESKFLLRLQILLDVPATCDANAARNWGTALEVAVKMAQEASIRLLLEHEAVLPPNLTISIGTSSNTRPNLSIRGIDVSRQPQGVDIVPSEFMTLLADNNVTEKDARFERNCLEWLDSKNSRLWQK